MSPWDLDVNLKSVMLDLLYLSSFILVGTLLRRYVKFFQTYLIPNNFIGGAIALLVGTQGLGLIDLQSDRLVLYVYHFLALTFISLGLRQEKKNWGKGPLSKSIASLISYLIQGLIGLLVAFILVFTIKPDLFVGIGMVVPLGFGMGPGLAATLAASWEKFGFDGGAQVGLTFAAVGYLYSFFVGMALINWGIRRKKTALIKDINHISDDMRTGVIKNGKPAIAGHLSLSTEAIEPLAFHIALIGFVYLITYIIVDFLAQVMMNNGLEGFVATLWSFHFVVGLLLSLAMRKITGCHWKSLCC